MNAPQNYQPVLVTGCSSGIGQCIEGLKDRGYRVFASVRQEKDIQPLIEQGFEAIHRIVPTRPIIEPW